MKTKTDPTLIVLVLDADGPRSELADAVRNAGHRVVTAMGLDTAVVVLGGLTPDLILVRAADPADGEQAVARLQQAAPEVPIRLTGEASPFAHPSDGAPLN